MATSQEMPKVTKLKEARKVSLLETLEEAQPCLHLDLKQLASRTQLGENQSLVLNLQGYNLLQQPQDINTEGKSVLKE